MPQNISPLTRKILSILADYCKERIEDFPGFLEEIAGVCRFRLPRYHTFPYLYVRSTMYNLERGGYIKRIALKNKTIQIAITRRGATQVLRTKIAEKIDKGNWDGKWRLVIFDVPEWSRHKRDFLRKYLKEFGLLELQKSVWIFPYDIEYEFKEFLRLCNKNFEGDVRFVITQYISHDVDLRRKFQLLR